MENNPYIYQLSKVITYSKGGDFEESATVEMRAPGMNEFDESQTFGQLVMGAIMSNANMMQGRDMSEEAIAEAKAKAKDETPEPSEIKIMLMASQTVKITDIAKSFRVLACKVGFIGTDIPLLNEHIDKMEIDDFLNMLCGYVANFTYPSLFSGEGTGEKSG